MNSACGMATKITKDKITLIAGQLVKGLITEPADEPFQKECYFAKVLFLACLGMGPQLVAVFLCML